MLKRKLYRVCKESQETLYCVYVIYLIPSFSTSDHELF